MSEGLLWSPQHCKHCKELPCRITITMDDKYSIEHKQCGIFVKGDTPQEVIDSWDKIMSNWDEYKGYFKP